MKKITFTILLLISISCVQKKNNTHSKGDQTLLPEMSLYHLPSSWTTHNNKNISLIDLKGKVLVVVMIYTTCKAACPRLVADMKLIEAQIDRNDKNNLQMILVSIDPKNDTPESLSYFAKENNMDTEPWLFLRGTESTTREFAAVLAVKYKRITPLDFSHSNIISVFDPQGNLVHQQEGLGVNNQKTVGEIKTQLAKIR